MSELHENCKIKYIKYPEFISRFNKKVEKYANTDFYQEMEKEYYKLKSMEEFSAFYKTLNDIDNRWKEYLRPKISILLKTNFGNHNNQHFIDFLINDVIMNDTQKEMRADIIIKELSVKKERGVPQYWNTFLSQKIDKNLFARLEAFRRDPHLANFIENRKEALKKKYDGEIDIQKKQEIQARGNILASMHYKISLQLYHEFQNQQTYNGFCAFERELSEFKNYLQSNQQGNQYNQNRNPIPMNNQTNNKAPTNMMHMQSSQNPDPKHVPSNINQYSNKNIMPQTMDPIKNPNHSMQPSMQSSMQGSMPSTQQHHQNNMMMNQHNGNQTITQNHQQMMNNNQYNKPMPINYQGKSMPTTQVQSQQQPQPQQQNLTGASNMFQNKPKPDTFQMKPQENLMAKSQQPYQSNMMTANQISTNTGNSTTLNQPKQNYPQANLAKPTSLSVNDPSKMVSKTVDRAPLVFSYDSIDINSHSSLKKDVMTQLYHRLKNPYGKDEPIERFKREVEEAVKEPHTQEVNIYEYEKKVDKKVKTNSQPDINMYSSKPTSEKTIIQNFASQIAQIKKEFSTTVEERHNDQNSVELIIFKSSNDKITLKLLKNQKIEVTEMVNMNDFFYQNMNPLNEALSTGNLVQTIKLWIGFLEKCANDAQKIIQEFDDMFD